VLILCPSCRHPIRVRDLRPGRFTPRCPRCDRAFLLTVPDQPGTPPVVGVLDPSVFAEPVAIEPAPVVPAVIPPLLASTPGTDRAGPSLRPAGLPRGTPRLLGGRLLLRLLGHGPRGRAFLARPLDLGPAEVVKQVAADRAGDPIFLAHHVREALAAAEIDHPNLVRLETVGIARGLHYSTAPFVAGPSLDNLLEQPGALDPYQATVVILQAARGLAAAHAQGLWHRDVKPGNLRLTGDGLAKVDDLGLETTPSLAAAIESAARPSEAVRGGQKPPPPLAVVGTPAFMAPEQSRDAARLDGRADVYALGATYYALVTGRPPFEEVNADELIRKHREETPVPAEQLAPGLPRPIADALRTMLRKHPEERYPNMSVVVDVLENLLDLRGEAVAALLAAAEPPIRSAAEVLAESPARRVRVRILRLCGLIGLSFGALLFFLGLPWPAFGILTFLGLVGAIVGVSSAVLHGSRLLRLALSAALAGPAAWGALFAAGALSLAGLWWRGGFLPWFLLSCAGGLAAGYHLFLDRPWAAIRVQALEAVRDWVARLRARGLSEQTVQDLVARVAGPARREMLDAFFGREARQATIRRGGFADHRGPISVVSETTATWLERRVRDRRDRRHQDVRERAEEGRLQAAGLNLLTARRRARRIAKAMGMATCEWRDEQRLLPRGEVAGPSSSAGPSLAERLQRAAEAPEPVLEPHEPQRGGAARRLEALLSLVFGRLLRVLLAGLLLGAFAVWLDTREILTLTQVRTLLTDALQTVADAVRRGDPARLGELRWTIPLDWDRLREPVDLPGLSSLLGHKLSGANLGMAGLVLLLSALSGRRLAGAFALLAGAVILFGPRWGLFLPALAAWFDESGQARLLGAAIAVLGLLLPGHWRSGPG
jgi:hypothetical protein